MPDDAVAAALRESRHEAASDDELITAVVDGSGTVVDLRLDPRAMRSPSVDLAAAIEATLRAAQELARVALPSLLPVADPPTDELTALATTARSRLDEMTVELTQLLGRLGGTDTR